MNPDKIWNLNIAHKLRDFNEISKKKTQTPLPLTPLSHLCMAGYETAADLYNWAGQKHFPWTNYHEWDIRSQGRDVASMLPSQEHSCQPVQLSVCRTADTAPDHVLKLNVLGLLWSSQHNLQPAPLTLSWAWGLHGALLMLLRFPGICSYQQENLTGKHNKILKPEVM